MVICLLLNITKISCFGEQIGLLYTNISDDLNYLTGKYQKSISQKISSDR